MTQLAKPAASVESIERVLIEGDLSRLSPADKLTYYMRVCESLGLNPYTKPFDYLRLNGREILYARKDATDQLRKLNRISITRLDREQIGDLMVVTAAALASDGRQDSAIGAVPTQGLKGEALANALMKAETKAKRRVTLSICGLGMTDDSEVESIPNAIRVNGPIYTPDEMGATVNDEGDVIDVGTGEVVADRPAEPVVPMITSVDDKVYQRYVGWTERAAAREIDYEAYGVPVERQKVYDEAVRLKGLVEAAEREPEPVA